MSDGGLRPPLEPMEARHADALPVGPEWQYEPKWDGFRCLLFRHGDDIVLQSKSKPLGRYFPDIVAAAAALPEHVVLDGELLVADASGQPSFDDLLLRLHPAASRVATLAARSPAVYVVFDCLQSGADMLIDDPLAVRRGALEQVAAAFPDAMRLSPVTGDAREAEAWLARREWGLDGLIAKQIDAPYAAGERAMLKIKRVRTADCVIGGFRYATGRRVVGSLLLGLYDDAGLLHHVGFTSGFAAVNVDALTATLESLRSPASFTGRAPGGPSRWNQGRAHEWEPVRPELVVEVSFDHTSNGRFRHGTRFIRWRPDKAPTRCTMAQLGDVAARTT